MGCYFGVSWDGLQDGPRAPQEAPRPLQERPKSLQEAAKSAPGGSKRASRHPESRSRGLKSLKTHPKRLQKTLRTLSIQTKHFEELQRCPARMPKVGGRAAVSPQRGRQSAARTGGEGRTACFRRNEQAFVQVVEDFGSCSLQLCPHRALEARNGGRSRRMYNLSAVLCI